MLKRRGGNQQIKITNQLAGLPELTTELRKAFHDCSIQGQNAHPLEKASKDLLMLGGIAPMINAIVDLAIGN